MHNDAAYGMHYFFFDPKKIRFSPVWVASTAGMVRYTYLYLDRPYPRGSPSPPPNTDDRTASLNTSNKSGYIPVEVTGYSDGVYRTITSSSTYSVQHL